MKPSLNARLLPLRRPPPLLSSYALHITSTTPSHRRSFSGQPSRSSTPSPAAATDALSPRWLSTLKSRLGRCLMWGLTPAQVDAAGAILEEIAHDWRFLLAGSEGFLTGKGRRGLWRHGVAWGEMDVMGHINNVMYVRYAESARINWTRNFANYIDPENAEGWNGLMGARGKGMILRRMTTEYKFPMTFPDRISVFHKLRAAPSPTDDSFQLDVIILSELRQRPAARCYEDIVLYDYKIEQKTSLDGFMYEGFMRTFEEQERVKEVAGRRVRGLLERVRALEMGSWDREGAIENMGERRGGEG